MITFDITPYQAGDANTIISVEFPFYRKEIAKLPLKPAYTARYNGRVLGCAGVKTFWRGVGEVWLVVDSDIEKYRRELLCTLREYLEHIVRTEGFWRIQAVVRKNFPQGLILAKHMGFEVEGCMKKYGTDGVDCFLMARIFE